MEFITRFKNALFLIVVLLAQAIALAMQVRTPVDSAQADGRSVRLIRMWATAAVTPFERAAHGIGWGIHYGWSDYIDLRHTRQQNKDLQQQLTRMHIEEAAIAEDALQGRRLQALLAFREKLRRLDRRGAGHRRQRQRQIACAHHRQGLPRRHQA